MTSLIMGNSLLRKKQPMEVPPSQRSELMSGIGNDGTIIKKVEFLPPVLPPLPYDRTKVKI